MKAVKILSLLFVLTFIVDVYTQSIECGTTIPAGVTLQQAQSANLNLYKRTTITQPLRLAVHVVRYSNGSDGILQNELNQKIQYLENLFEQALFDFYVFHIDYINSDTYSNIQNKQEADELRMIKRINGCINIYFVPECYLNGISSFSSRIQDPNLFNEQGIIIINDAPVTTLPHEMGHYFDLFHTYETYFDYENIARTGSCSNWNIASDLLEDTPADPYGRYGRTDIGINYNCEFVYDRSKGILSDACGDTNWTPLTNNMMTTDRPVCRTTFTEDQINRMNQTLEDYRSELLLNGIFLENQIANDNAGGTLHINSQEYNSYDCATVDEGNYNIGTNNERFVNYQSGGSTYKHNNFNDIFNDYFLTRTLSVTGDMLQIAKFKDMNNGKIEIRLEGNLITNKGYGYFQDPWYVLSNGSQPGNYWKSFTSFYEPTGKEGATEKGVFLNQDYRVPGQPYYSVKADAMQDIYLTQTGRTHRFYFRGWTAAPQGSAEFQNANALETPVVFKQDGATVQANLKGTQLSNNSNAYSKGNQRKFL